MPFIRRRRITRKRRVARRPTYRRRTTPAKRAGGVRYFTETFAMPAVPTNSGLLLQVSMDMLPANQLNSYRALYTEYKIHSATVTIVPNLNSYNSSAAPSMPRIAWVHDCSAQISTPNTEQDVLSCNSSRLRSITTKWSTTLYPKPDLGMIASGTGNFSAVTPRSAPYLAFGSPNVTWNGVKAFISEALPGGATPSLLPVYVKLRFSLRNPI